MGEKKPSYLAYKVHVKRHAIVFFLIVSRTITH